MDITNAVLLLICAVLGFIALRLDYALRVAHAEIARLVAQSRPSSPHAAGYDTGLLEHPFS